MSARGPASAFEYDDAMAMTAESLRQKALALPAQDRATLAADLLASLDEADDADAVRSAWREEIDSRVEAVVSGEAQTEPWETVRQRIADDLNGCASHRVPAPARLSWVGGEGIRERTPVPRVPAV